MVGPGSMRNPKNLRIHQIIANEILAYFFSAVCARRLASSVLDCLAYELRCIRRRDCGRRSEARAALAGAYSALTANGLYGHTIVDWTEGAVRQPCSIREPSTITPDADLNPVCGLINNSNTTIWKRVLRTRLTATNQILQKVPNVKGPCRRPEQNEILGEGLFPPKLWSITIWCVLYGVGHGLEFRFGSSPVARARRKPAR